MNKQFAKTKPLLIFIIVLLLIPFSTSCGTQKEFLQVPEETYEGMPVLKDSFTAQNGTVLPYSLYFPLNYDPGENYPFLLYLHEAGARGSDNQVQIGYQGFLDGYISTAMEQYPCFILIPQCAEDTLWVDVPWTNGYYRLDETPVSSNLSAATELLHSVLEETDAIDQSRLYVLGLSMGGYGTWDIITRNPELFAAAVPACGGCDAAQAEKLKDLPIWTFHGSEDQVVPNTSTQAMVKALQEAGSSMIKYTEYEGEGHIIEPFVFYDSSLYDWLFEQKK